MVRKGASMEKQMTTKQKIIIEALRLFSAQGYDGASMRDIAEAVGIKGASIYNHFKGKEDIFNGIFEEMTKRYDAAAAATGIPPSANKRAFDAYSEMGVERLLDIADAVFSFYTQDEFALMFRKLLAQEKHRSPIAAKYFKEYYLEAPLDFQRQIFEGMQENGKFPGYDAAAMALHFYGPIFYILCKFDSGYSCEECDETIKEHVRSFCEIYKA